MELGTCPLPGKKNALPLQAAAISTGSHLHRFEDPRQALLRPSREGRFLLAELHFAADSREPAQRRGTGGLQRVASFADSEVSFTLGAERETNFTLAGVSSR